MSTTYHVRPGFDLIVPDAPASEYPRPGYGTLDIFKAIHVELNRAREKHPAPFNSKHEGIAILLEEYEEAQAEVFHGKSSQKLLDELIQVAAMAVRMIDDLKLTEKATEERNPL